MKTGLKDSWRRYLGIVLVGLVGLNVVTYLSYTMRRVLEEQTLAARVSSLESDVQREGKLAADLRRRMETMEQNRLDLARFYSEIVGQRKTGQRRTHLELEEIAAQLGLRPERSTYTEEELKGAPLMRFKITMPLTGSYKQLISFVDRLEHAPRFLTVDQVHISARGEASLDVLISAYFRTEAKGKHG